MSREHDLVEENADRLYSPNETTEPLKLPIGYAALRIDMTLMSEDNRGKVYQAEELLKEAGITFDTGSGFGCRDWELDFSLEGAFLDVRRIDCRNFKKHKEPEYMKKAYWAVFEGERGVFMCAYCSPECRNEGIKEREKEDDKVKVIWQAESEVL